jgi:hypothetical protein
MSAIAMIAAIHATISSVDHMAPFAIAANNSASTLLTFLECDDANQGCAGWAASGECANNAGFMHSTCRKSCDRCHLSGNDAVNAAQICRYAARNARGACARVSEMPFPAAEACASHILITIFKNCRVEGEGIMVAMAHVAARVRGVVAAVCVHGDCAPATPMAPSKATKAAGSASRRTVTLRGGAEMPRVGVGTWMMVGEECSQRGSNSIS